MRITDEVAGGGAIIVLAGDEDTKSDENLNKVFRRSFEQHRFYFLLDMERLKYLGSRMLRVVIANTKQALNGGGKVKLLSPQPQVKAYLKESKILEFFEIYNTRQLALESFANDIQAEESAEAAPTTGTPPPATLRGAPPDRLDRIENQLLGLVSVLREKGLLSEEEEKSLFPL